MARKNEKEPETEYFDPVEEMEAEQPEQANEPVNPVSGSTPGTVDTQAATVAALGKVAEVLEGLTRKADAGPVQQIPIAKAKFVTPWHPTGERRRPKLARPTFLNQHRLREMLMSNEEIELCNQLKPGFYQNRRWRVVTTDADGGVASMSIYLPNKTEADRLEMKTKARDLADALRMIVAEQNAVR
jgi:hypothetical protein